MLTPPEKNSASTTLMRRPSRTSSRGDLDRRHVRQPEHVDRQPRRHEVVGAVALLDRESQQADDDAAVQRVGVPRPVARPSVGMKASRSLVKKG